MEKPKRVRPVQVCLTQEQRDYIENVSKDDNRTVSNYITMMVHREMKDYRRNAFYEENRPKPTPIGPPKIVGMPNFYDDQVAPAWDEPVAVKGDSVEKSPLISSIPVGPALKLERLFLPTDPIRDDLEKSNMANLLPYQYKCVDPTAGVNIKGYESIEFMEDRDGLGITELNGDRDDIYQTIPERCRFAQRFIREFYDGDKNIYCVCPPGYRRLNDSDKGYDIEKDTHVGFVGTNKAYISLGNERFVKEKIEAISDAVMIECEYLYSL